MEKRRKKVVASKAVKRRASRRPEWEVRSDRRTAEFLARQIDQFQDELGDLVMDFRTLRRFTEMECAAGMLIRLQWMARNCRHFAEEGEWP